MASKPELPRLTVLRDWPGNAIGKRRHRICKMRPCGAVPGVCALQKGHIADRMIVSSAMTQTAAAAVAFCDDKYGQRCASSWGSDGTSPGDD
jgi:hypothetical protein